MVANPKWRFKQGHTQSAQHVGVTSSPKATPGRRARIESSPAAQRCTIHESVCDEAALSLAIGTAVGACTAIPQLANKSGKWPRTKNDLFPDMLQKHPV